jgi:hypothetical protein
VQNGEYAASGIKSLCLRMQACAGCAKGVDEGKDLSEWVREHNDPFGRLAKLGEPFYNHMC